MLNFFVFSDVISGFHAFYNSAVLTFVGMNLYFRHWSEVSFTFSGSLQPLSYFPSLPSFINPNVSTLTTKHNILYLALTWQVTLVSL